MLRQGCGGWSRRRQTPQPVTARPGALIITLILFLASCGGPTLPVLKIYSDQPVSWTNKEPCRVDYLYEGDSLHFDAKIKYRGGVSSKYHKQSYTIRLKERFAMVDMPADRDWIINAAYIDKTFMRHKISFDLFREMDYTNIAPRCRYIDVYRGKKYQGIYILMERMDATRLGLERNDGSAMMFKDPPVFFKERLKMVQDTANYYHQKYPNKDKDDKTAYIESFRELLFKSSDVDFKHNIHEWVDLENVVDLHLLLLFTNNSDGLRKNFYLYKIDSDTPFRFAIWDYDHSFGRDGDNEMNMLEVLIDDDQSVLFKRLKETNASHYNKLLQERWIELRKTNIFSNTNIALHIKENHEQLAASLDRNFEVWPVSSKWYFDDNDYEEEIEIIKEFVEKRLVQLDKEFGY
ncbi:MAG: CotH kinase family protein [Bacteroidetes bacterium]|nr:CotH kinase family protein [Bacteroidota bacterium]